MMGVRERKPKPTRGDDMSSIHDGGEVSDNGASLYKLSSCCGSDGSSLFNLLFIDQYVFL